MVILIVMVVGTAALAATVKLGIGWLDPGNVENSWIAALIVGAVFGAPAALGGGFIFSALPLIAMIFVFLQYYDLELLRSLGLVLVMAGLQFLTSEVLYRMLIPHNV